MTPLIASAPSSGAGSAGPASTGPASTGLASTGSGSAASAATGSFASVLAVTDPAPPSVGVSAASHGESGSAGGSAGSTSGDQPADPASAATLAANFAVAALALPVPVPVPVTPAAASAWSANRPASDGPDTSVQSVAGASQPLQPAGQVGQSPMATTASATTAASTATAASATIAPSTATAASATTAASTATAATAMQPPASPSGQPSSGTAEAPSTDPATPAVAPAATQGFVGGLRTIKPPTQPNTATAGSAQFAAPVAGPLAAGADRPAVTPVGGPNVVPVLVANPPVEQRPSPPNKPITPVVTHDPAGPVLAGHPLPRPTNDSGTGSNDREHPSNPQPSITPAGSTGFSLTDASQATLAANQPVVASQPVAASQPINQPATAQSTMADQLPVSHQLSGPVLSLRTAGDGSHQLTIALHPAELGPVNLHVKIVGDSMAIQLASTSEGAHDALREALPQLRQELQAAGLGNVDLSLDLGGAPSGNHAQAGDQAQAGFRQPESGYQTEQPVRTAPRRSTTTESGLDRWL
jgi:flagellar hook-length control protein FliK